MAGERPVGGQGGVLRGGGGLFPAQPERAQRTLLAGGHRLQAEIRRVQRPGGLRVAEVDPHDGQRGVLAGHVLRVPALKARVLRGLGRNPLDQDVDLGDQLAEPAALLDERARDERRALGEEVQDVQAGGVQQALVEQRAALAEAQRGPAPRAGGVGQLVGQSLVAEPHRLDVVHIEVAERVQRGGQLLGDQLVLVGGARPLAGSGVADGPRDQLGGELAEVLLGERALLAPEREEGGNTDRLVDQPGARPLLDEQLLDERCDDARRQARADDCGIHVHSPR
ncbi:hypothetical protein SANTM175S_06397 [Streptomyces antimycoticus]